MYTLLQPLLEETVVSWDIGHYSVILRYWRHVKAERGSSEATQSIILLIPLRRAFQT